MKVKRRYQVMAQLSSMNRAVRDMDRVLEEREKDLRNTRATLTRLNRIFRIDMYDDRMREPAKQITLRYDMWHLKRYMDSDDGLKEIATLIVERLRRDLGAPR